jgi:hypothetical protein
MFIACHISWCFQCSLRMWFVESFLEMDAFEFLDSYADELAIVRPDKLVVIELESFILLEEVLQVQGVVDEE